MHGFQGVAVCFPTGGSGHHTQDDWQSADWIFWSTGELRVDNASFALVFCPGGCGNLAAKPLGCLTGAAKVAEPGGLNAFVASTNDPVHGLVRLTFQSLQDEEAFATVVQAAERVCAGRYPGCGAGARATLGNGRRSSTNGSRRENEVMEAIAAHVCKQHPGGWPLVFGGAELYGPDARGEQGNEVLLGRGVVVLLDPQDTDRVGAYELMFYEECSLELILRMSIGPRIRLSRELAKESGGANGRLSMASQRLSFASVRGSLGGAALGCPVAAFNLTSPGGLGWVLTFDDEIDAAGFARDFSVRQRLTVVSLKTSRGWRTVDELQGKLMDMQQYGILPMLRWFLWRVFMVVSLMVLFDAASLYANEPDRHLLDVATVALQDAGAAFFSVGEGIGEAGTMACGLLSRSVSVASLERCVALPDSIEVRACVAALTSAA